MNNVDISKVYLLSVPLENDYKNTLYFTSKSTQQEYFSSKILKECKNFTYLRKEQEISVPYHYDDIYTCNYVMYQNSKYNNKWFYCFVKDMRYENDECTILNIETDVIQTWLFDYTIKPSFVEREHVSDDTAGIHTVPELLETGDYIVNTTNKNIGLTDSVIVMGSTVDPTIQDGELVGGDNGGGIYNGVRTGYKYYTFNNSSNSELSDVLKAFEKAGKSDAIGMMFVAPKILIDVVEDKYDNAMVQESLQSTAMEWDFMESDTPNYKPTTLNTYEPRNKKLLTFPYTYMLLSNNNGGSAVYKYELFDVPKSVTRQDLCPIQFYSALTPSMDIIAVPQYYNGSVGANYNEALSSGKYPICGWNTDVYTNWLTQNAMNIGISTVSSALTIVGGVALTATGGGAFAGGGMIVNGAMGIAQTMGSIYEHKLQPPQAEGNVNTGNVNFACDNLTFTVYNMSIKKEMAAIIDSYFDMFGYKVNAVKVPNKAHRSRYWYTKTIDINIDFIV